MASVKRKNFIENYEGFKQTPGGIAYNISIEVLTGNRFDNQIDEIKQHTDEEIDTFPYWGVYKLEEDSFLDDNPIVRFNNYDDLELTEQEREGYLTDRIIAACSSHLDKNPLTGQYVLCKCDLHCKRLENIELLCYHPSFQCLNLAGNKLKSLEDLSGAKFLIWLDASNNRLTKVLDFKAPYYLTYVYLSGNMIKKIDDLSEFWALVKLDLSHNSIKKIEGLMKLKYLQTLNLSYNKIHVIENLDYLNIIWLDLQENYINSFVCDKYHGFKTNTNLSYVQLANNSLSSLEIFENAKSIQSIYMNNNHVAQVLELINLKNLNLLIYLDLSNNPCSWLYSEEKYIRTVLMHAPKLNFLDTKPVDELLKVEATEVFDPDIEMKAAEVNATITILHQLQETKQISINSLPCDNWMRPIIVLVTLPGSRAESFIHKFPKSFLQSERCLFQIMKIKLYSTCNNPQYTYIKKTVFEEMALNGEFAFIYEILNYNFGLTHEDLELADEVKSIMFLFHSDIYAALSLRLRGYQPWLVLALPKCEQTHKEWLNEDYKIYICEDKQSEMGLKEEQPEVLDDMVELSSKIKICFQQKSERCSIAAYIENNLINSELTPEQSIDMSSSEQTISYSSESNVTVKEQFINEFNYEPQHAFQENWLDEIMKQRELYMNFHTENLGVFYEVLYMDEYEESKTKLTNLFFKIIEVCKNRPKEIELDDNNVYRMIVENRLKKFKEDIDKSHEEEANRIEIERKCKKPM